MVDGRVLLNGRPIPIAVEVADTAYCFPSRVQSSASQPHSRLLCAGRERCLPGYHVNRHDFNCLLVELVVEGHGKIRIDGKTHELFPGVMLVYGMNHQHDLWSSAEDPMKKYFAAFELSPSSKEHQGIEIDFGIRWTRDLSAVQVLFEELIREGRRGGELHEKITGAYLEVLLLKVAEALPSNRVPNTKGIDGRDLFERALSCVEANFRSMSGLAELARRVDADGNRICRLFRRFGDETPIQCITRHKLNDAAELLLTTNKTVGEIATFEGYQDPYYFSRVFKKRFGIAPTDFRSVAGAIGA